MYSKKLIGRLLTNLLVLSALALAGTPSALAADLVPIGVAKVDVTPDYPVRMYGYASRKTPSEGVAGRLSAKALAIGADAGDGPAVLLAVDCGAVPKDIRDEVLRRVAAKVSIKPERFMLANSHNHSGPNVKGMANMPPEHREPLERYAEELTDALEKVVLKALSSRSPCRLAWTRGTVGFAANRRVLTDGKWTGFGAVRDAPVDHALPLLRVTDPQGKLRAVVVNYACHCTTLRGKTMQIHGDWAGCAQQFIEADHPGVIAMITIGCAADADPCPHGTIELCRQHGRAMADEVKRLIATDFVPVDGNLAASSTSFDVAPLESATSETTDESPEPFNYSIATWVFGDDLAMIFMEGEVVVDYALRINREFDASRIWINAYTNDVPCYIVSKRLIGEGGYEVRNSVSSKATGGEPAKLQPAMEDRILQKIHGLLPAAFQSR